MIGIDLEVLARESVEVFNRGDWNAIRAMLAPSYCYEELGTNRRFDNAEDTIAALREWKAAAPDVRGEVARVVVEGDTAVLEICWRGTQTGPLNTGAGELPASGRSFEMWGSMWQLWRDGKIAEERNHIDVLSMLAQLGALDAAPEPA